MGRYDLKYSKGLTLIELMITVAITAIIAMIGVPSFKSMIDHNRITSASNDLLYHLMLARSEAVKLNTSVIIFPLSSQGEGCSTSSDWSCGWSIKEGDAPNNGSPIRSASQDGDISISSSSSSGVMFGPMGNANYNSFTITLNDLNRYVCLEVSGRAYVSHDQCAQVPAGGSI